MSIVSQDTTVWLVAGVLGAGSLVLLVLLAVQGRRLRAWKRAHGLIKADYRNLAASHARLRAERDENITSDDHALLTALAGELQDNLIGFDGDVMLTDADAVHVATIPVPIVEIEYPDRLVTLRLAVEHYADEEAEAQA